MSGLTDRAAMTCWVDIRRSKVICTDWSTGTDCVFTGGSTETTEGAPTVVNDRSAAVDWVLPARSCTPGPTRARNLVDRSSFAAGVKMSVVRPCQWKAPLIFGE